jgi:hypothetical protein
VEQVVRPPLGPDMLEDVHPVERGLVRCSGSGLGAGLAAVVGVLLCEHLRDRDQRHVHMHPVHQPSDYCRTHTGRIDVSDFE